MPLNPFNRLRFRLKTPARRARLSLTSLEDRSVPAVTAAFAGGVLTVTGDGVGNDLSVELVSGKVSVFENASTTHTSVVITGGAPTLAAMTKVVVNAGLGDDNVTVFPSITKPAELFGEGGSDNLTGGKGNDIIVTGTDLIGDSADGGDGNDSITGGPAGDFLTGGNGNDTIVAGDGANIVQGGAGNDSLTGGIESDDIFGGDGLDTIDGGDGDDRIRGDDPLGKKPGNDNILGGLGNDIIVAGKGNDTVNAGEGDDIVEGGDGNDNIRGGPDTVTGFTGPDDLGAGDVDVDSLYGGAGNDTITAGWGNDKLYGEAGNDSLVGGVGQDTTSGGFGLDVFVGHGASGALTGLATDLGNFDTYKDEFDLSKPVHVKAEPKDLAPTELGIQAALAGFASVANNQKAFSIPGRIRYLGTGEYLVKLGHTDSNPPDPTNPDPFGYATVEFNGTWTDNDPQPNGLQRFPKAKESREFWTILMHRAVVQTMDGSYDPFSYYTQADYNLLGGGLVTNSGEVVGVLTGDAPALPVPLSPVPPPGYTFDDIKANLAAGFWLTAQTGVAPGLGLQGSQAYAITKTSTVAGVNYITLYNPSGFDKGTTASGDLDQTGKKIDDGFIIITATDFFANFVAGYQNG